MYDAIVVGSRVAGSTTAMLLARRGLDVLLVDRSGFPSDTICAHRLGPVAVALLERWGLLDRIVATGCPPAESTSVTVASTTVALSHARTYAPRRHLLDAILLDAAAAAGVQVREGFAVRDVIWEGDRVTGIVGSTPAGHSVYEAGRIVIGADGRQSVLANAVRAEAYWERPSTNCCYYSYWSGLEAAGPEVHLGDGAVVLLRPTNNGQICVMAARPVAEWAAFKRDPETGCRSVIGRFPDLAARVADARRESRFFGTANLGASVRAAWGPRWALVGDAGVHMDALAGSGISDALFQAHMLADAVADGLTGRVVLDAALHRYHRIRDDSATELYDLAFELGAYRWAPSTGLGLIGRLHSAEARQLHRIPAPP